MTGLSNNSGDRRTQLFIVMTVMLGLAWILVLLRAYVRVIMIKNVAADDWWMLASILAYTGYSIVALWGLIDGGTGKHISDLKVEETLVGLKAWYICEVMYALVSAMVRTSVALFLHRVATETLHKWVVWINLATIYIISLVFTFIAIFQCNPPSYFYEQVLGKPGGCMDIDVLPNAVIAHSVIGAVTDLVFAALPVAMLWDVQLNKRTKIVVALLLSMGAVAGIALVVRIPFVKKLAITPDFLYETVDVAIWSVMEPSLGIIAGCMATLRPLFKSMGFGKPTTQRYGYGSSRHGPSAASDRRTWGFSRNTMQKLGDGPFSPSTMDSSHLESRHGAPYTSNNDESDRDFEMQPRTPPAAAVATQHHGKGTVSTKIATESAQIFFPTPTGFDLVLDGNAAHTGLIGGGNGMTGVTVEYTIRG
ncbi:integral membrane protein [Diaporthe helianthi]|uniref:Integral membrane protein n=1 Tax=Diaporthe helianthi TaxID=158607 RepID=A0A2P5HKU0_DIAHE|nr:integral membrane protein [Diaporthe helianthi]